MFFPARPLELNGGGYGRVLLVMIFFLILLLSRPAAATVQRDGLALQTPEIPASIDSSDRNVANAATNAGASEKKKQQVATVAVYLLALVVFICVALLIVVLLWGRRVRQLMRKPSKSASLGDELWYLKPKKNQPTGEPPSTNAADGPTSTETGHNSPETP